MMGKKKSYWRDHEFTNVKSAIFITTHIPSNDPRKPPRVVKSTREIHHKVFKTQGAAEKFALHETEGLKVRCGDNKLKPETHHDEYEGYHYHIGPSKTKLNQDSTAGKMWEKNEVHVTWEDEFTSRGISKNALYGNDTEIYTKREHIKEGGKTIKTRGPMEVGLKCDVDKIKEEYSSAETVEIDRKRLEQLLVIL